MNSSKRVLRDLTDAQGIKSIRNYLKNPGIDVSATGANNVSGFTSCGVAGLDSNYNPTGALTIPATGYDLTLETTSPLRGNNSFSIAAVAAPVQKGFASDIFTIERSDLGQVLTISFDYLFTGATGTPGLGGGVDPSASNGQMIGVYIYDVTNSEYIVINNSLGLNTKNVTGKFVGSFQASTTVGQQYRLLVIDRYGIGGSFVGIFDNFYCGESDQSVSSSVTTAFAYMSAATFNGGAGTIVPLDTVHYDTSGSFDTSAYEFVVPESGYYNISGLIESGGGLSSAHLYKNGSLMATPVPTRFLGDVDSTNAPVRISWSTQDYFVAGDRIGLGCAGTITNNSYLIVTEVVSSGESSDGRIVAASYSVLDGQSVGTGAGNVIKFIDKAFDTHAAYNTSTGVYSVPETGKFRFSGRVATTGTTSAITTTVDLKQNGTIVRTSQTAAYWNGSAYGPWCDYDFLIECAAGDQIEIFAASDTASAIDTNSPARTVLNIERLSGASTVQANEKVIATYTGASTSSVSNTTDTDLPTNTKSIDTHGAYTSNIFTAPSVGYYEFKGYANFTGTAGGSTSYIYLKVVVNGTDTYMFASNLIDPSNTHDIIVSGTSQEILMNPGDTAHIYAYATGFSALAFASSNGGQWISIKKV